MFTRLSILLALLASLLFIGCGNSSGPEFEGDPILSFEVDWGNVTSTSAKLQAKANEDSVTHFGVRIIYPVENAVFTQSVENTGGDSTALITMEVPQTDSARIYAVAVYSDPSTDKVVNMGTITEQQLNDAPEYTFTVSDFTWYAPNWHVKEGYETAYNNGASVDKSESRYDLHYMVHNPFDRNKGKYDYDSFLIKIAGTGGWEGYEGDYKEYFATATNPTVGDSSTTYHNFFPYLDSELFNLPTGRYVVGEKGNFTVNWE